GDVGKADEPAQEARAPAAADEPGDEAQEQQVGHRAHDTSTATMARRLGPEWRNGIRSRLKIGRPQGHEGSTPSSGTTTLRRCPQRPVPSDTRPTGSWP